MKIAKELNRIDLEPNEFGTIVAYEEYENSIKAIPKNVQLKCFLTNQLKGLEGQQVKVIDNFGETRFFYVGKSTGAWQIHLEIPSSRSSCGMAASENFRETPLEISIFVLYLRE